MHYKRRQSGQTIIETLIAVFILAMALSSGLGLAVYAAGNSLQSKNQITAENLAKEGTEVVRMLRDTNWLNPGALGALYTTNGGCTFSNGRHPCYPEAFHAPYDIENTQSSFDYRLNFLNSQPTKWRLERVVSLDNYLLCLQPNGMYRHNDPINSAISCTNPQLAQFARRVVITTPPSVTVPYTPNVNNPTVPSATGAAPTYGGHSPQKIITTYVVWQGKRCTPFPAGGVDPVAFSTRCKVVMTEYLTNWKDYK